MRPGSAQLGVRRAYRRPSVARRMARSVDAAVTRVQEWLEGPDKPVALVIGYGVLLVAFIYLVVQIARWVKWS